MRMFVSSVLFLLLVIILGLYLAPFLSFVEGYKNRLINNPGCFPESVDKPILNNNYPLINKNIVSDNSASSIWKYYPIFPVSSYKQITNNLRYWKNPDDGDCSRAEFCGALYHNKEVKSNEVYPLPPADEGSGARIGYYRSEPNYLYYSIPTNENILY
jgi:hypothetical protein